MIPEKLEIERLRRYKNRWLLRISSSKFTLEIILHEDKLLRLAVGIVSRIQKRDNGVLCVRGYEDWIDEFFQDENDG